MRNVTKSESRSRCTVGVRSEREGAVSGASPLADVKHCTHNEQQCPWQALCFPQTGDCAESD